MKVRRETAGVLLISEGLGMIMGALALSEGNNYPGLGAFMGGLIMALPFLLERMGLIRLPIFVQIWALLAIGLHTFGLVWKLYDTTWWWDEMTHAVSSSLVGMLAAIGLYLFDMHSIKIKVPRWAYPIMIMVFSIFIGVIWEMGEFTGDVLTSTRMQYSLSDTLNDCYVDMLGGLITSALWILWFWRDPTDELGTTALEPLIGRFKSWF